MLIDDEERASWQLARSSFFYSRGRRHAARGSLTFDRQAPRAIQPCNRSLSSRAARPGCLSRSPGCGDPCRSCAARSRRRWRCRAATGSRIARAGTPPAGCCSLPNRCRRAPGTAPIRAGRYRLAAGPGRLLLVEEDLQVVDQEAQRRVLHVDGDDNMAVGRHLEGGRDARQHRFLGGRRGGRVRGRGVAVGVGVTVGRRRRVARRRVGRRWRQRARRSGCGAGCRWRVAVGVRVVDRGVAVGVGVRVGGGGIVASVWPSACAWGPRSW